ncbi:MAG: hypothetical protein LBQ88_10700 [Treponema sp.]|nr:hypothetical protein [Treponema sp.]
MSGEGIPERYRIFIENGFLPVNKDSFFQFRNFDDKESVVMETTSTILTVWGGAVNALYKIIQGLLCITVIVEGSEAYFEIRFPPPAAGGLKAAMDSLWALSLKAGFTSIRIGAVEEAFLSVYDELKGYNCTTGYSDDHSEYLYRTGDLLELAGGVNLNKRTRLKKFLNNDNFSLSPLTGENIGLCLEIQKEWCLRRDCASCASFAGCETKALENMVAIFDPALYNGIVCFHEARPVGYVLWENRAGKTAFIYFAKANTANLNVYLYYMAVKQFLSAVEFININEDMGNMGIRMFKSHLGVYKLLRKYSCILAKTEG